MTAIKIILHFVLKVLIFSLIVAGAHYAIAEYLIDTLPITVIFEMHAFIVLLTIMAYIIMVRVGSRDFDKTGFAFLGLVLVKMIVAFAFLYPYLKSTEFDVKDVVINFFAVYLLFVLFEARQAYLLILKGPFTPQ